MKSKILKYSFPALLLLFLSLADTVRAEWVLPKNPGLPTDFNAGVNHITDWLIGLVVILSVLALVWGGLRYVTSSGSRDEAEAAKKTIQYAIIGLAVAGVAYAFINTIITQVLK